MAGVDRGLRPRRRPHRRRRDPARGDVLVDLELELSQAVEGPPLDQVVAVVGVAAEPTSRRAGTVAPKLKSPTRGPASRRACPRRRALRRAPWRRRCTPGSRTALPPSRPFTTVDLGASRRVHVDVGLTGAGVLDARRGGPDGEAVLEVELERGRRRGGGGRGRDGGGVVASRSRPRRGAAAPALQGPASPLHLRIVDEQGRQPIDRAVAFRQPHRPPDRVDVSNPHGLTSHARFRAVPTSWSRRIHAGEGSQSLETGSGPARASGQVPPPQAGAPATN